VAKRQHNELTAPNRLKLKNAWKLVKKMRLASEREATQKLAETPYLFGEIRQTDHLIC
jgi:hypothetical protein